MVIEVLGVEHVNGQDVFCFSDDVNIKASRFAAKGGFRPVRHDDCVGKKAVAEHNITGAAPNLHVVAIQVLDGLNRDVFGLVNVDV